MAGGYGRQKKKRSPFHASFVETTFELARFCSRNLGKMEKLAKKTEKIGIGTEMKGLEDFERLAAVGNRTEWEIKVGKWC